MPCGQVWAHSEFENKKGKNLCRVFYDRTHGESPRTLTPWLTHALSLVSLSFTRSDPHRRAGRPAAAPVRQPGPAPPPLRGAQRRPAAAPPRPSAPAPRRHRRPAPAPQVRCLHDSKQIG